MTTLKTITSFLAPPDAAKGERVTVIGGAFEGRSGTVVDTDGLWRTVETAA